MHPQPSLVGHIHARERAKQGCLAGAAATDERDALARRGREADAAESPRRRRGRAEAGRLWSDDPTMSVELKTDTDALGVDHAVTPPSRTVFAQSGTGAKTPRESRTRSDRAVATPPAPGRRGRCSGKPRTTR